MKRTYIKNSSLEPIITTSGTTSPTKVKEVWQWGVNNLLPLALLELSHNSSIHRRILQDKANYIAGQGFKCNDPRVENFAECCNSTLQSLRAVISRVALDKSIFGNGIIEVASKDGKIAIWHQDITKVRIAKDGEQVVLNPDWANYKAELNHTLPLYPNVREDEDGVQRTAILLQDYEPMFSNYGVPKYIASIGAIAIAHKTEKWNITRLDNAFSLSGVMILDGTNTTPDEADELADEALRRFKGTPGQVMFMVKNNDGGDNSKFIPISTSNDGDWKSLQQQSLEDIIIAHSWFRTLSGLEYASGFSAERVQNEYNIALSTVIKSEQQAVVETLRRVIEHFTTMDASTLEIINIPPFNPRQPYMRVWEARKADGLDFDPNAKDQKLFLSEL